MKAKDGSMIELVDNRIYDADITNWNGKASVSHTHSASDIDSGTLSTARGGTGTSQSSMSGVASALINSLSSVTSTPNDADYYVSQYAGGGTTNTSYHRRPVSALWEYIKDKISSVLGLTASAYSGKAATAGKAIADASGNNIEETYATKSELSTHTSDTTVHITAAERTAWNAKQSALTFDTTPTAGSTNPVTSEGIKTALEVLQSNIDTADAKGIVINEINGENVICFE